MHLTVHCVRKFCQWELPIRHFQIVHSSVSRVSHRRIRVDHIRAIHLEIHIMVSRCNVVDLPRPVSLHLPIFPKFYGFLSVQCDFCRDCLRSSKADCCRSLFHDTDAMRNVRIFSCRSPSFIGLKPDLPVYRIKHQHLFFHGLYPESLSCNSGSFFSGDIIRLRPLFPE